MSRVVRKVPKGWEHPKNNKGNYKPMYNESFEEAANRWKKGFFAYLLNPTDDCEYWEWDGDPPDREYYRPAEWENEERTHYQMYETCTEGTPISPVMDNIDDLAHWLADNKASVFGRDTASYEEWLKICKISIAIGDSMQ